MLVWRYQFDLDFDGNVSPLTFISHFTWSDALLACMLPVPQYHCASGPASVPGGSFRAAGAVVFVQLDQGVKPTRSHSLMPAIFYHNHVELVTCLDITCPYQQQVETHVT